MRWPWWLKWRRRPPGPLPNGTAYQARAEQEAKLRKAQRDQRTVEHIAKQFERLPPDDFLQRVQSIFSERGHRA